MEILLALTCGGLFAAALHLLMSRRVIRMALGFMLLGSAVNLAILAAGRIAVAPEADGEAGVAPPLVPESALTPFGLVANPLPQALILTAIVIGLALLLFFLLLCLRLWQSIGDLDSSAYQAAEPVGDRDQGPALPEAVP